MAHKRDGIADADEPADLDTDEAEDEASADAADEAPGRGVAPANALYLYGITRSRTWRPGAEGDADGLRRLRYRGLEALTRSTSFETPELNDASLQSHQRVLDEAMRRGTVLPAPFGIVFRDRRRLLRMLQEQYDALDDGLRFLDGHWELRLHIGLAPGELPGAAMSDLAMQLYTELRRAVRAAVPFPHDEPRLLSAAFLVERSAWLDFMQRADDVASHHPEISFDITGPWPAYDFVRISD